MVSRTIALMTKQLELESLIKLEEIVNYIIVVKTFQRVHLSLMKVKWVLIENLNRHKLLLKQISKRKKCYNTI